MDDPPSRGQLGWIKVTHTCRRWRMIAVGHALLWTPIPTEISSNLMKLMMQRSNGAPMVVRGFRYLQHDELEVKALLQDNLPHIIHLEIGSTISQLAYADGMLIPKASMLRTLHLHEDWDAHDLLPFPNHSAPIAHPLCVMFCSRARSFLGQHHHSPT